MITLTVSTKGQVTLRKDLLRRPMAGGGTLSAVAPPSPKVNDSRVAAVRGGMENAWGRLPGQSSEKRAVMTAGRSMKSLASYTAETRGIRVSVEPFYLESQSEPAESRFVWAYKVQIENTGPDVVQLRHRYWRITDAMGRVKEVRGAGVVGEQPVLRPGETFEYTSGTPLSTASGIMAGTYEMHTAAGEIFEAEIPAFSLDSPHQRRSVN